MVVKTPFPVSLLLTAESFLNIPKSELFILNSKPEIGTSAFRGGVKSILKIGQNYHPAVLAWGGRKCKQNYYNYHSSPSISESSR